MKRKLCFSVLVALCLLISCVAELPVAAADMEEYVLIKEDTFEGDACTIATSQMLSNPQTYLWDNVSTIDGADPRSISGNGLLFQFADKTNETDRWVTPLRIDASKVDIRNGYYTITMQLRHAGIKTLHFQLKTLNGDILVGEYYFDVNTLATLDTGNGQPIIGSSSVKDGITEVVLDFGSVSEVYVDVTAQVDVYASERYMVLDNVRLHGLQLEDYPQLTYRVVSTQQYTQSTGIWQAGADCKVLENRDDGLYAQVQGKNATVLKSEALTLPEGYYKIHFQIKPEKVKTLTLGLYSNAQLLYECEYDIESISTGITKNPVELYIEKDKVTGLYTLSVCFQQKTESDVHFEVRLLGEKTESAVTLRRFDILESFDNQFDAEEKPVNTVVKGQTNGQFAAVASVRSNGVFAYLLIVGMVVAAAVIVVVLIVVRRRGRKG